MEKLLSKLEKGASETSGITDLVYLMPEFAEIFTGRESFCVSWEAAIAQSTQDEYGDDVEDIIAGGSQPCIAYRLIGKRTA
jgi:hypothetical protein